MYITNLACHNDDDDDDDMHKNTTPAGCKPAAIYANVQNPIIRIYHLLTVPVVLARLSRRSGVFADTTNQSDGFSFFSMLYEL